MSEPGLTNPWKPWQRLNESLGANCGTQLCPRVTVRGASGAFSTRRRSLRRGGGLLDGEDLDCVFEAIAVVKRRRITSSGSPDGLWISAADLGWGASCPGDGAASCARSIYR